MMEQKKKMSAECKDLACIEAKFLVNKKLDWFCHSYI